MISRRLFLCSEHDAPYVEATALDFVYVVLEDGHQPFYDERVGGVVYRIDDARLGPGDAVGLADHALRRALQAAASGHRIVEPPVRLRRK